jgi:Mg-chelatase subunit ChlD
MNIEWSTLTVTNVWPVLLGLGTMVFFIWQWHSQHGKLFPDINLISRTRSKISAIIDHFSIVLGTLIIVLLLIVLTAPSIEVTRSVERTAREFMVLLDSSGSMQGNTRVPRAGAELNYERPLELGLIPVTGERGERGVGVSLETVPYLARYEVARESIRRFLEERRFGDRVGLVYFNNTPFVVSIVTQNVSAIKEELKWLDDYVALGTLLYRGLEMATNVLENSPSGLKQAMILISDAEISNFSRIEPELDRLKELNISLHLLWLGEEEGLDSDAKAFLEHVQAMGGNIVALTDLTNETLDAAFEQIDRLESYSYPEIQKSQLDIAVLFLRIVQWLILLWVLLILTFYHPGSRESTA